MKAILIIAPLLTFACTAREPESYSNEAALAFCSPDGAMSDLPYCRAVLDSIYGKLKTLRDDQIVFWILPGDLCGRENKKQTECWGRQQREYWRAQRYWANRANVDTVRWLPQDSLLYIGAVTTVMCFDKKLGKWLDTLRPEQEDEVIRRCSKLWWSPAYADSPVTRVVR